MKYTIAIDSFKGSLTSAEAGNSAAEGIKMADPDANVSVYPLADGGEGTVEALAEGLNGEIRYAKVNDPLGRPINAKYAFISDTETAVIEMSAASGITLLSPNELDPMKTSTYGTGMLIKAAIEAGCRNFIIGIGGSATNDGGVGCLQALGFEFLDKNGNNIPFGAYGLSLLETIKSDNALPILKECRFNVACDVDNPLCGDRGCSAVFSPQKGALEEDIPLMDSWLNIYYEKTKLLLPSADKDSSGSGAAGGLGFALKFYLNADLVSGAEMIVKELGIEESIKSSDIVITGEGCIDVQTTMGKAPSAVARIAQKYNKKCIAIGGIIGEGAGECNKNGITAYFPIIRTVSNLEQCMDKNNARKNLMLTVEQIVRLML